MNHMSFRVFCLVFLSGVIFAAFGDDATVSLESRIIETFDNTDESKLVWHKQASRYSVGKDAADKDNPSFAEFGLGDGDFFPKLGYFDIWPMALFRSNRDGETLRSLGIWGKFKRMGYNWMDIYPTLKSAGDDAEPFEIPITGRVRYLDMWVWGSNLNFYVEAYLRDQQGVVHTIYLGNIGYQGWKNLRASIPTSIAQRRRILPDANEVAFLASAQDRSRIYLKFIKFRVWTTPREAVGNFYIYFDQFKVLTDTFESLYDGDEMLDPEWIQNNWNADGSAGAASN